MNPVFHQCSGDAWDGGESVRDERDQEREAGEGGKAVLMKQDSTLANHWAKNCQGEKGEVTSGGAMIISRVLEDVRDCDSKHV